MTATDTPRERPAPAVAGGAGFRASAEKCPHPRLDVVPRDSDGIAVSGVTREGDARPGRSVLEGALAVLDVLAGAQDGAGLSELARTTGLAKTSAHRLAEQLVTLGAAQRLARRYYIGERIARIGLRWQPDPLLRQAAQGPVHNLAACSGATASLRILHQDRLRVVCATAPRGRAFLPEPTDRHSTARTATGRVLYAAQPAGDVGPPDCWSPQQWRQLRATIRDAHVTVIDRQEVVAGICCVSAPVWWPDANCAGAVTAVVASGTVPPALPNLVSHTAQRITKTLATPH